VDAFSYEGEGWGLCYDGEYLYMTDGSPIIDIRDPETFEVVAQGAVTMQGQPVNNVNELECVGDSIYANIWKAEVILKIDKATGAVTEYIDATGLLTEEELANMDLDREVLNGIAYNAEAETFYITGKKWPRLFEVNFVEATAESAE
jgi:glutaminyl-peptide cyclotransferase